jgi:hypothetical protein
MHTIPNVPASVSREAYARLCGALPPPAIDTPEARAERESDAMAAVVVLRPGDAFEARLAVQIVAADAHVVDCLRLAAKYFNSLTDGARCRAQAGLMMRQMQAALRTLQKMQATRTKAEAADRALAADLDVPALEAPADEAPAAPAPQPEAIAEAEEYAARYPFRAARIRANGGLQRNVMAGFDPAVTPPSPAIIEALVAGTSPALCALDNRRKIAARA